MGCGCGGGKGRGEECGDGGGGEKRGVEVDGSARCLREAGTTSVVGG